MNEHPGVIAGKSSSLSESVAERIIARLSRRVALESSKGGAFTVKDSPYLPGAKLIANGSDANPDLDGLIVGTIRMGYGHYRMALAIASQALALGVTPYWFDFLALDIPESDLIREIDRFYSKASRISDINPLLDLLWEQVTGAGTWSSFKFNLSLGRVLKNIMGKLERDTPVISSHIFNAVVPIAAGFRNVFHQIPDNTPLAFHISPDGVNLVQTPSLYSGYRQLGVHAAHLAMVGHYIDHELTANLEQDIEDRLTRQTAKAPMRLLFNTGGAGAQRKTLLDIINYLSPRIQDGQVALIINCGDHSSILKAVTEAAARFGSAATEHRGWTALQEFVTDLKDPKLEIKGLHFVFNDDHFVAVLATNLLMRHVEVLLTKPSELSFYPVPKLFLHRIGKHEAMGAIRGSELGEGTNEARSMTELHKYLELLVTEPQYLQSMCEAIMRNAQQGIYDGAKRAVEMAMESARKP